MTRSKTHYGLRAYLANPNGGIALVIACCGSCCVCKVERFQRSILHSHQLLRIRITIFLFGGRSDEEARFARRHQHPSGASCSRRNDAEENGLNEQCEDRVHGVLRLSRRFARVDGEEVVDVARAGMKLDRHTDTRLTTSSRGRDRDPKGSPKSPRDQ